MEKNKIDRREFLKTAGLGVAATTAALYGCTPKDENKIPAPSGEVPTDRMTYRTNPTTGDRVSLLGYGCMRWYGHENETSKGCMSMNMVR